jgi:tripartite-type tricarboxylate transporter receptor subunit TctC
VKAVATPKAAQQFAAAGSQVIASSPPAFTAHIQAEIAKWGKVTQGFKATPD